MSFYQLHKLFEDIASNLEAYIDLIAERVTALGGVAMGMVRIAAKQIAFFKRHFRWVAMQICLLPVSGGFARSSKNKGEAAMLPQSS